jgi:hypothetical protein
MNEWIWSVPVCAKNLDPFGWRFWRFRWESSRGGRARFARRRYLDELLARGDTPRDRNGKRAAARFAESSNYRTTTSTTPRVLIIKRLRLFWAARYHHFREETCRTYGERHVLVACVKCQNGTDRQMKKGPRRPLPCGYRGVMIRTIIKESYSTSGDHYYYCTVLIMCHYSTAVDQLKVIITNRVLLLLDDR